MGSNQLWKREPEKVAFVLLFPPLSGEMGLFLTTSFWLWGVGMKFSSSGTTSCRLWPYSHRCLWIYVWVVKRDRVELGSLKGRAVARGPLWKESPRVWMICWMKNIRYLRRLGPKATLKRKAAIGLRRAVRQEKQGLDISLKIPKRERWSSSR